MPSKNLKTNKHNYYFTITINSKKNGHFKIIDTGRTFTKWCVIIKLHSHFSHFPWKLVWGFEKRHLCITVLPSQHCLCIQSIQGRCRVSSLDSVYQFLRFLNFNVQFFQSNIPRDALIANKQNDSDNLHGCLFLCITFRSPISWLKTYQFSYKLHIEKRQILFLILLSN